ncbi:MAG TPA: hypothetical protein VGY66_02850, partial [Gemmataceae bacterium]|nr:hypothetical protein [Gemmataceae bacterium]
MKYSWIRQLFGRPATRTIRKAPKCARPSLERLEERTMLAVSVTVTGSNVKFFSPDISDTVYLQASNGTAFWSSDAQGTVGTFQPIANLTLASAGSANTFTFQMSGAVHLENFTGSGGDLTFQGTGNAAGGFIGPSDLHIDSLLLTQGGKLNINDVQGVDVASNVVVSTRHISDADFGNGKYDTGKSVGSSGTIDFEVANTDVLNPFLYVNFTDPHIKLGANASLLANGTDGHTSGDVTLDVTNINYSLISQLFPELSLMARNAKITLDTGAQIKGNNVTLNANAGDLDPLTGLDGNYLYDYLPFSESESKEAGLDKIIALLDPALLPASVFYRNADAGVTVGQFANITADGFVDLESNARADAAAASKFLFNTKLEISVSFNWAQSDAETDVAGSATISAGGDVTVHSVANSQAVGNALVAQNPDKTEKSGAYQFSSSTGVTKVTSHATVDQQASISAGGNINVQAEGVNRNKNSVAAKDNTVGTVGLTIGVGVTTTDIKAEVDGTLVAGSATAGVLQTINPFTQIDWGATNSIITYTTPVNFSTGEEITYSAAGSAPIPGLEDGINYYVINVPNQPNSIQLAATHQDALIGKAITFGSFPFLSATINGKSVDNAIINVNSTSHELLFGYDPGFTAGQTVIYHASPNLGVASLVDGVTYTIQPVTGQTNAYQLLDASQHPIHISTDATFRPIPYLTATIKGTVVNIPINLVDDANNALQYDFDPGFNLAGQSVTYHAADGQAIGSLVNNTTYTIKPLSGVSNEFQLFDTQNSTLVPIITDPTFDGLARNLSATLNEANNTLSFNFNPGFTDTSLIVYQGATGAGAANLSNLQVGQAYWVLPDDSDASGETFQLASSPDGTPIAIGGGGSDTVSLNFQFVPVIGIDATSNSIYTGFNIADDPSFANGTALTYHGALGYTYSGLQDGTTYYAITDPHNPQVLRLATSAADAQTAYTAGTSAYTDAYNAMYNSFLSENQANGDANAATDATASADLAAASAGALWSAAGINSAVNGTAPPTGPFTVSVTTNNSSGNSELLFSFAHGLKLGDQITYEGPTSGQVGISGLTPYQTYFVIPDAGNPDAFALAATSLDAAQGKAVAISLTGSTAINFGPAMPTPQAATLASNELTFGTDASDDQGWRTGDAIIFGGATDASGSPLTISTGNGSSLQVGQTYYAVVDPSNPNVVQLADTLQHAQNNLPLPLSANTSQIQVVLMAPLTTQFAFPDHRLPVVVDFGADVTQTMSGAAHTLTPLGNRGVNISATLHSDEAISSQAIPGKVALSSTLNTGPYLYGLIKAGLKKLGNKLAGKKSVAQTVNSVPGGSSDGGPDYALAGSVLVGVVNHNVQAIVGSTAVITSGGDVSVHAATTEKIIYASQASLTLDPSSTTKVAAALAFTVSVYSPTIKATVQDGAQIDATGALNVTATLEYPFAFPTVNHPASLSGGLLLTAEVLFGIITDSALGLQSLLSNDWTRAASVGGLQASGTTGTGAKYGIGGVIDVHSWNNDVEATIGNARINQLKHNSGQSVNVKADTTWDNIGVDGTFDVDFAKDSFKSAKKKAGTKKALASLVSFNGAQGSKGGIGATIDINVMDNTTLAQIASGAQIHIGSSGSLKVDANQTIVDVSLNQAGASAGDIGFAGTVVWNNLTSSTIAQIEDGVDVNSQAGDGVGGPVTVKATDSAVVVSLSGGVATGNRLGFDFTLAVNNFNRTTLALIGSNPITNGGATPLAGAFNVAGLDVEAITSGTIVSVSFAAGVSTTDISTRSRSTSALNPTALVLLSPPAGTSGEPQVENSPVGQTGVGFAGDVGVNVMQTVTEALINDPGTFTVAGNVTVNATNNTVLVAGAGAIALAKQETTGKNVGLAGSFSVNVVDTTTEAWIQGATISANQLNVNAEHSDVIVAITVGGAGAAPNKGSSNAVAGSVSINLVLPTTVAYVSGATLSLIGDSPVTAEEQSEIWSVAGAGALGGNGGYGAALGLNIIGSPTNNGTPANPTFVPDQPDNLPVRDGETFAYITDSTITMVGGTLTVQAINDNPSTDSRIIAISGSLGAGSQEAGIGGGGMLSVNIIQNDTEAYISNNTSVTEVSAPSGVTDPGSANVLVHANDSSGIVLLGGAVGIGQKAGVGLAFGFNEIHSSILADLDNATLTVNGAVTVKAESTQSIGGVDVGVAAGTGKGWAAAGSVLVNIISNTIDAHIANSSDVQAGGAVTLQATDQSLIVAIAGAVGATVSGSNGVGASISYNRISNGIAAYIDSSTVTTSDGSISLLATSTPTLVAIGAAGAGGKSISGAGTLTINSVANTVDAHIIGSPDVQAFGDVSVNSSEAASMYVAALT